MISNRHRTKLVSLKHVVRWRLSLAFSIFITLRKTKLPVNAKKSRYNQSHWKAACTEIFVFRRSGFLMSPLVNRKLSCITAGQFAKYISLPGGELREILSPELKKFAITSIWSCCFRNNPIPKKRCPVSRHALARRKT